ncbi:MAG: CoA transferase [Gammaproteobacteria bacterium]
MLDPYRVLDLTDDGAQLCGQILGSLGADVVLLEPPGGSRNRARGPFVDDLAHPDRSLVFWSLNRHKRAATLDLATAAGRERLRALAARADVLLESFTPGYLAGLGLDHAALARVNPRLVSVSLTPYGSHGPKAAWPASDLTALAASGVLYITGDADRAPVRLMVPQAGLHGAAEGAAATLIALAARRRDGLGQHVDVSAQTATMLGTQFFALSDAWGTPQAERVAGGMKAGPVVLKFVNPARDGHVSVTFFFGESGGPFARRLMHTLHERGYVDLATRDKDWINYTSLLLSGAEPASELMRCIDCIAAFTSAHTKAELFALARERDLLIVPVATVAEVAASEQLAARDYWVTVAHPELERAVRYPGAFAKFSATPLPTGRRPPLQGEHDAEIFGELPVAPRDTAPPSGPRGVRRAALADLKVLDLMWVIAGPASTRMLADHGATVVHIESSRVIDAARTVQPLWQNQAGTERAAAFANVGAGKLGLTLNLRHEAVRPVLRRLVEWADVVTESFACGAMQRLGLDYATLSGWNPRVIVLSSCLNGQTGPHAALAGFGTMGAQMAGFGALAGWPDRAPAGPFGAYTDYVAPKFTVAALLAALEARERSGRGQYIDLSQSEASLHFIAEAVLDHEVNGRVATRMGNASPHACPHGVFRAAGEERWVAIAAETEPQWRALAATVGPPTWLTRADLATLGGRQAARAELEAGIEAWTVTRDIDEIERLLVSVGVPTHRVATSADLGADPQLAARGHFVPVPHAELGTIPIENARALLAGTPPAVTRPGPLLGQHTDYVLRELLGLPAAEVERLRALGALD